MRAILIFTLAVIVGGLFIVTFATSSNAGEKIGVIVVDMQGDFTTWKNGSLAVNGTDQAFVEKVEKTTVMLKEKGYPIFATQDWHPTDHVSFCSNHAGKKPFETIQLDGGRTQVLWPPHCVQGTKNAEILLDNDLFVAVVKKGKDKRYDSYSGFQDDGGAKTEMNAILKENGIKEVIVYGIATDYCVKATAMDAADAGYKVTVVEGLCKGVAPETSAKALDDMKAKGIVLVKELE
ncbi:MAG: bifunctional nicotinamidase/pyrazinamidase [Desulfobacteraceae bacterium]|jgi:nicotinamidase/pyrazinamidase